MTIVKRHLEYWAWMLHDLADNIERAVTYEPDETATITKFGQWEDTLQHIKEDIKDQLEHQLG